MLAEIQNKDYQFFQKLQTSNFFSAIDIFFSNKLKPINENQAIFFAYIFLISRLGFVSLQIEKDLIYPKPQDLNIENDLDNILQNEENFQNIHLNSIDDNIYQLITQKVIDGSKSNLDNVIFSTENILDINIFPKYPICRFQNFFYLQKNFIFETKIIENLKKLTLLSKPKDIFLREKFSKNLENEKTLQIDQKKAIENALKYSISFILGGPGTGKTYVASHLINIFSKALDISKKNELQIAATSFTGKATSHLKSNIFKHAKNVKIEAKTLHSLLNIKEGKAKFFKDKKIDFDLIIVDESSMIDIKLMAYLLDAIKQGSRIVFIGDPNQLPPIDGGNLFKEISDILLNQTTLLKRAHRFENDVILDLATAIELNAKNIDDILDHKIDFFDLENINAIKNMIFDMAKTNFFNPQNEKIEIKDLLNKINEFRILSSIKKGSLGVDTLNQEIFSIFYKEAMDGQFLYVPIIITKNNYKLDLYNGQIGIVSYQKINVGLSHGIAHFLIDGEVKSYSIYYLSSFQYAYAISIHKSQGSEFESSIVIIPETLKSFGKELFYTAVTRVKNNLHLISSKKILFDLIKKSSFKKSALSQRIF